MEAPRLRQGTAGYLDISAKTQNGVFCMRIFNPQTTSSSPFLGVVVVLPAALPAYLVVVVLARMPRPTLDIERRTARKDTYQTIVRGWFVDNNNKGRGPP
jgi:hypothetical protein